MERWTEEETEFLKQNYKHMSYIEIGKILNRKDSAIRAKCFDLGLIKNDRWTKEQIELLKQKYQEIPSTDLAKIFNKTKTAVNVKAKKLGLKKSKYICDYSFFENIDSEEKAYWLGFIYADGWISVNKKTNSGVLGIELQIKDIAHLKKFNKSLNGNYKISTRERIYALSSYKEKLNKLCCIRIFSIKMVNDLKKLGVNQNKTYDIKFPFFINDNLMPHFIRGFFDGDGCVRLRTRYNKKDKKKVEYPICDIVCYEKSFLEELRKYIYEKYDIHSYIYPEKNLFRIYIHKYIDTIKFVDLLYENASIYLERKYSIYQKIKNIVATDCLTA